ncbi:putative monooxygenase/2-heptyl-3-hydroxy-4(1H)-quinolone synthase [Dioscorea sansibarensis]
MKFQVDIEVIGDGVVLARFLAEALKEDNNEGAKEEHVRIRLGLEKYVSERKWRGINLVTTAYVLGRLQQSDNAFISFLREKVKSGYLLTHLAKMEFSHMPPIISFSLHITLSSLTTRG